MIQLQPDAVFAAFSAIASSGTSLHHKKSMVWAALHAAPREREALLGVHGDDLAATARQFHERLAEAFPAGARSLGHAVALAKQTMDKGTHNRLQ